MNGEKCLQQEKVKSKQSKAEQWDERLRYNLATLFLDPGRPESESRKWASKNFFPKASLNWILHRALFNRCLNNYTEKYRNNLQALNHIQIEQCDKMFMPVHSFPAGSWLNPVLPHIHTVHGTCQLPRQLGYQSNWYSMTTTIQGPAQEIMLPTKEL